MTREEALNAAEEALDEGRLEDALAALDPLDEDDPERALLGGQLALELGALEIARAELDRAATGLDADDPDLAWWRAELHLAEWRIDEARAGYERLAREDRGAALDRLALCQELAGELAAADESLARLARLEPEAAPQPPRFDEAEFDAVVEEAVEELPPAFRAALERARVVREPVPFRELVPPDDPASTPADLLGLFVGETLHELAEDASASLPPTIYLFQRNLERACRDRGDLREQIRVTLFHELGHLLGLDEDEVEAMGLG